MRKSILAGLAIAVGSIASLPVTSAHAASQSTIADVLLSDSARDDANGFDHRWWDYDIVTQAVLLFPDLAAAASNPDAELTVFAPTDGAFRALVHDLTGQWVASEADVFAAVAGLGVDTVKSVLLYHIVPASISYGDARRAVASGPAELPNLNGATLTAEGTGGWWGLIRLVDQDPDLRDPIVIFPNVRGKLANGYIHGIDRVLLPVNL
jgi:uncharacterized surface protein with fasciclin (FAS1) repeats